MTISGTGRTKRPQVPQLASQLPTGRATRARAPRAKLGRGAAWCDRLTTTLGGVSPGHPKINSSSARFIWNSANCGTKPVLRGFVLQTNPFFGGEGREYNLYYLSDKTGFVLKTGYEKARSLNDDPLPSIPRSHPPPHPTHRPRRQCTLMTDRRDET